MTYATWHKSVQVVIQLPVGRFNSVSHTPIGSGYSTRE